MSAVKRVWKYEHQGEIYLLFECPGCGGDVHQVNVNPGWDWNASLDSPTLNPSVLVRVILHDGKEYRRCHSYVRNGKIEYLSDCFHGMKNKTVDLPVLQDDWKWRPRSSSVD